MAKRIIVGLPGLPGRLAAAAMLAAAHQTGGMFVKPTDLGGSAMPTPPRRTLDLSVATRIGKLQKTRGRL